MPGPEKKKLPLNHDTVHEIARTKTKKLARTTSLANGKNAIAVRAERNNHARACTHDNNNNNNAAEDVRVRENTRRLVIYIRVRERQTETETEMGDYNIALLVIVVVVTLLVVVFNVYLLVNYQHPDDSNQAYFPKLVVVLGLSVAQLSILMLPADIANQHACQHSVFVGACSFTLPMRQLWYAVYILDAVLVFFVIPFSIFYYEGDQEK